MICEARFLDPAYKKHWYCDTPELIENYDKAIADTEKVWICHHRLEEFYTSKELISMNLYYHRPPEELVFCENETEHHKYPHKTDGRIKKGQKMSDKTKKRMSDSRKGKMAQYSKNKKPVLCIETNTVYESIHEAERQTGMSRGGIRRVLKGVCKTAGGFHWRYV